MNLRTVSFVRAAMLGLLVLLVSAHDANAQAPDLLAFNAQGPGQAQLDNNITVNALLLNLGGPLPAEDITLEILLSADTVVDAGDLVIGTKVVNLVGAFTVSAFIPDTVVPGPYNFALRIPPITGESDTTNNAVIGNAVNVFTTDLCLVGSPNSLTVGAKVDGPNPAPQTLMVANCAATSGILIFTVFEQTPAPWLDVTPSTGFAVAGFEPQPVTLLFNTLGLGKGEYSTTLQIVNFGNPGDTELVTVTLVVDDIVVRPGDLVLGTIDEADEADECVFSGVAGMKFKVKVEAQTGNLRPKITILDHDDRTIVQSWTLPHSSKALKKSAKLPESGKFILRIEGEGGSVGAYEVLTGLKLPPAARKQKKTLKPVAGSNEASVGILALPGGELDFSVTPKKFTGPLTVSFLPPTGGAVDISANTQSDPDGGATVTAVPLDLVGEYTITLGGFATDGEKVKLVVTPTQPVGTGAVILP